MNSLIQDLRHGVRGYLNTPAVAALAILTLALGIGANTAIFSVVNAVLFRPLPYHEPQRLARALWQWNKGETPGVTTTQYDFWSANSRSFGATAAFSGGFGGFILAGGADPLRVTGLRVSESFLPLLGVPPFMGRNFTRDEDSPTGPRAMLISHALWRSYYGSDPNVLNRTALLDGESYSIIGVLPADFFFEGAGEVLLPLRMVADPRDQGHNTAMIARLAPGVSLREAQAEMDQLLPRFREAVPKHIGPKERGIRLETLQNYVVGDSRNTLMMLLGAVGFVLLIACANVANLLLARASGRSGELAIRAALGASRARLVRQLMIENVGLAMAGGALGYILALWMVPVLLAATPEGLPRVAEVRMDAATAGFAFLVALFTSMLFGAVPAWRASRVDLNDALKAASGKLSAGRALLNARSGLVVVEVALALMLLVGAGLFLRSFVALNSVPLGFDPQNLTATAPPRKRGISKRV